MTDSADISAVDALAEMKRVRAEEMALTRESIEVDLRKIAAHEKAQIATQVLIDKQIQAEKTTSALNESIEEMAGAMWTLLGDLDRFKALPEVMSEVRADLQDLAQAILVVQMASQADKTTVAKWNERIAQIAEGAAKRSDIRQDHSTHIDGDNVVSGGNQSLTGDVRHGK